MQIARLEAMAATLAPLAVNGDLPAIDRALKILDRLDRYHGFSRLAPVIDPPHEGGRERLLAKLNAMAERMIAARTTCDHVQPARPARKPRARRGDGWRNGGAPPLLRNIGALLELSPTERARLVAALSDRQCDEIFCDWSLWARDDQRPPPGDSIYWLILAGRGSGKTRAGAETVREWVKDFAIVNLIGATHDDVRDVMVLGESGLMAICPRASGRATRAPPPSRLAERRDVAAVLRRRTGSVEGGSGLAADSRRLANPR